MNRNAKKITIDGIRTEYLKIGKGRPLIVPPAWRSDIERFSEVFEILSEEYCVYFLDMPGYGNRSEFGRPHTMENYAEFMRKWIIKLDLRNADILGVSMGGPIAYKLMQRDAEKRFNKLILLAPWYNKRAVNYPGLFLNFMIWATGAYSSKSLTKLFERIYYNESFTMFFMHLISPKENFKEPENIRKYVINLKSFTGRASLESMHNLLKYDLAQEHKVLKNKTIFIMSKNDHQINYDCTLAGYKKLFPNLVEIPLTHKFHAPRTWITKELIFDYFGNAFIEASRIG